MNIIDRIRTENAVQRYDFWLELRGVRGRRRRELRRELRTNLADAAADVGVTRALFGIGSPKQLAFEMSERQESRPRWSLGLLWATAAFGLLLMAVLCTSAVVLQTVQSTGVVGREVRTEVLPWIGVDFLTRVEPGQGGLSVGVDGAPWYLLVPLLVFLLVAQPWRPFTHRETTTPVESLAR